MLVAAIASPRASDVPLVLLLLVRSSFHFHLMLESLDSAPQAFLLRLRTIRCARVRANKCYLVFSSPLSSCECATVSSRPQSLAPLPLLLQVARARCLLFDRPRSRP